MNIDKKAIYTQLESKFPDPSYSTETNNLCSHCMKLTEEWLSIYQFTPERTPREIKKDLKLYLTMNLKLNDPSSSYFAPSLVWRFIAGNIIKWYIDTFYNMYFGR